MKIIKRDGSEADFDRSKIVDAIRKANESGQEIELNQRQIDYISYVIQDYCEAVGRALNVEEIQEKVETEIINQNAPETAKRYIRYRYQKNLERRANTTDEAIIALIECNNEEVKQENSNKNPTINSVQRDYMAGEVSKDLSRRVLLPPDVVQAHDEGIIHMHDLDYFSQHMGNCCLVNLEDMLQNGTVISGTMIDKPHSFATACNIATQIIAQVASNQYGGQSISLTHLAPFVDVSRSRIRKNVIDEFKAINMDVTEEQIDKVVEARVLDEIKCGVQTIQYQVVTLMTTNGQAPFITVYMYLGETDNPQTKADLALIIEEVLKQRIVGVKNEKGVFIAPAFPKLIYVLEEDNIKEGSPYWYLTKLAAECTARRLVPDYISAKKMREYKVDPNGNGNVYPCMGCRSFLTPYVDAEGKPKYYGRWNQGVVTINLVDVACTACRNGRNEDLFWRVLDDRLNLCHKALRCRHDRLKGTLSDAAPILWQHGALARLEKGQPINDLMYGGYSTLSLGYAGLWECVYEVTGKKLTEEEGKKFGLAVMQRLNDACMAWRQAENIHYSLYGTPIESTTYKFAKNLQRRFGIIEGVTDKNYITNSYHVHVTEKIDAFEKLAMEAQFQALSPGGAISYVEVPDMHDNIPAVLEVIKFIVHAYDHLHREERRCDRSVPGAQSF